MNSAVRVCSSFTLLIGFALVARAEPERVAPDLTWDISHVLEHPFAIAMGAAVILLSVWSTAQLARANRPPATELRSKRPSGPDTGE